MKKHMIKVLAVMAIAAVTAAMFGFTSEDVYRRGKQDAEYSWVTAGCEINKGDWVILEAGAIETNDGLDTGSIVYTVATENTRMCLGVAAMDADTEAMIKIMTRGFCDYAKIDGVDSGVTGIIRGSPLSIAAKLGYAGSAQQTAPLSVTAANYSNLPTPQVIGVAIDAVTGRLNAAAFADTNTSYDVYVMCR